MRDPVLRDAALISTETSPVLSYLRFAGQEGYRDELKECLRRNQPAKYDE